VDRPYRALERIEPGVSLPGAECARPPLTRVVGDERRIGEDIGCQRDGDVRMVDEQKAQPVEAVGETDGAVRGNVDALAKAIEVLPVGELRARGRDIRVDQEPFPALLDSYRRRVSAQAAALASLALDRA
jgi:hypothetical protein